MTQRVAVAGSSGLIGGALRRHLTSRGDSVVRLVRHTPEGADEVQYDPAAGRLDPVVLEGVDAVVNLAGVGIGDKRWTDDYKRELEQSRVSVTSTLAHALADHRERTGRSIRLVNASAVGFYGDRADEVLTEQSAPGDDFLSGLVVRWEEATAPAAQAGIPVATVRTGLVMSRQGGAFEPLLRMTKLGAGGPLGSGRQWWPWITVVDEVRAITHLVDHPEVTGPVNLVAPGAARQKEIAARIASALSRPSLLPAPRIALRVALGEFADSILASQHVVPSVLEGSGFTFTHGDLDSAVRWLVAS